MSKEFTYWTSMIKKISIIIFVIIGIWISVKLAFFYMPFLFAFIISLTIEPLIRMLMKKFKLSRRISSIIVFIITFGIIIGILIWGVSTVISESSNLLSNFNYYYDKLNTITQNLLSKFDDKKINLPDNVINMLKDN